MVFPLSHGGCLRHWARRSVPAEYRTHGGNYDTGGENTKTYGRFFGMIFGKYFCVVSCSGARGYEEK